MLAKPKIGFVLGKFMPPHQGHVFLCEFARNYCEKLVILVCSQPDEPIPGILRYQWMRELFPTCDVKWYDQTVQQEPVGDDSEFWAVWKEIVTSYDGVAFPHVPDVIFASEPYGHKLAEVVGSRFVPVDIDRAARSVSGTAIRNDPFENWNHIPHVVRPYYTKRVTLFGPESTGKSTLAKRLARHYDTVYAPEYGRTYTEAFGSSVKAEDLRNIVAGHQASVAAAKRQANKIVIEDTDPVMTAVWSDMLLDCRDPWFDSFNDYADLYLLCDVDVPWEDDGTRYFENDRKRFFEVCRKELLTRRVNFVTIRGNEEERMALATEAIDKLLGV